MRPSALGLMENHHSMGEQFPKILSSSKNGQRRFGNARKIFVSVQITHILFFSLFLMSDVDVLILSISGVLCFFLYSWFFATEFERAGAKLSPFLFYLAASIFRLGVGVVYTVALYENGFRSLLDVGIYDVSAYVMEGHQIAMIGDLCFIIGYFALSSKSFGNGMRSDTKIRVSSKRIYQVATAFLIVSFLVRFSGAYFSFGGLGQLLGYISDYGPSASLYIMLLIVSGRTEVPILLPWITTWSMIVLNIIWSLSSYMKSDLFIALIPIILVGMQSGILSSRTFKLKTLLGPAVLGVAVTYFFLFVVSAYSELRRPDFWSNAYQTKPTEGTEIEMVSHLQNALLSAVPGTDQNAELHQFPRNGVWNLIKRMSVTTLPAWAFMRVETEGYNSESFSSSVLVSVIPRILWPEKPQLSPGADFQVTIGLARNRLSATSATALTLQGSYYWWGGMLALVIGCFVTGAGFALTWNLFARESTLNPISSLMTVVLFYQGFHWFENAFLGSLPFYLYAVIVFLPLQMFFRYFFLSAPKRGLGMRLGEKFS